VVKPAICSRVSRINGYNRFDWIYWTYWRDGSGRSGLNSQYVHVGCNTREQPGNIR